MMDPSRLQPGMTLWVIVVGGGVEQCTVGPLYVQHSFWPQPVPPTLGGSFNGTRVMLSSGNSWTADNSRLFETREEAEREVALIALAGDSLGAGTDLIHWQQIRKPL